MRCWPVFPLITLPTAVFAVALPLASKFQSHALNSRDVLKTIKQIELSNVALTCNRPSDEDDFNCDVRFDVHDPNSEAYGEVSKVSCQHSWTWDGRPMAGGDSARPYSVCWMKDPTHAFQSRIDSFESPSSFSLWISVNFLIDRNTTEPSNVRLFWNPDVSLSEMTSLHNSVYFASTEVMRYDFKWITM